MSRFICVLSLSLVFCGGVIGCGRSGDAVTKLSAEEEAKKKQEVNDQQRKGMEEAMKKMGRPVPAEGGNK